MNSDVSYESLKKPKPLYMNASCFQESTSFFKFGRYSFPDIRYTKSSGVYPFPVNPYPKATALTKHYNNSRPADKIPAEWKSSVTYPMYKKGCKNSVANYRPINLTSVVFKIVKANILQFLKTASILNDAQHGFMPKRSCLTNLIVAEEIITGVTDQGEPVNVVYLNFSKAFDL